MLRGFAMGSAVSAIAATGLVAIVLRDDDEARIQSEVVSAHLRSLQAGHLTDVISTDQHTVKPWFNGKLDVAPPVIDLTAQGFTLIGGRLDYVDARAIGAIVYRRRAHVINLFVAQTANTERRAAKTETLQGFNIRRWSDRGLNYWAVSDLAADELAEFGEKFEAAMKGSAAGCGAATSMSSHCGFAARRTVIHRSSAHGTHPGTNLAAAAYAIQFSNSRSDTASRSRRAFRPSFAINVPPSRSEGAGNAGRPMRPTASRARW